MEVFEPEIIRLRAEGLTRQEIADELGLDKIQIKNWINRYNKGSVKCYAQIKYWHLVEIYNRGRLSAPWLPFSSQGAKGQGRR